VTPYFEQIADAAAGRVIVQLDIPRWLIEHDPEIGALPMHVFVCKHLRHVARLVVADSANGQSQIEVIKVPLKEPENNLHIMARSLRSRR